MNATATERLTTELERLANDIMKCMGSVERTSSDTQLVFVIIGTGDLDLLVGSTARFAVTLPSTWPVSPPQVTYISGDIPPGSLALALNQPVGRVPLLDENEGWSRMYSLGVVYHSLRDLFKSPGALDTPWDAAKTPWLPVPTTLPASGSAFGFEVAHAGGQGRRRTMEDRCLLRQGVKVPSQFAEACALFGLFDGHAGDACAEFSEAEVPGAVLDSLAEGCGWREALCRAFLSVDARFLGDPLLAHTGAGCTACVVLFDGKDKLVCANLGDCRAILCGVASATAGGGGRTESSSSSFCARDLTFDCRAERPDEVARVVQRGGFVNNKRVNGQLAVSRALGDADFKKPPNPFVSSCPEITETRLQPGDEFLLIACDGLWDVMTSEEAGLFVRERLAAAASSAKGKGGSVKAVEGLGQGRGGDEALLESVAAELVKCAIEERRSTDNVSVVLARVVPSRLDGSVCGRHPHPPLPLNAAGAVGPAEEGSRQSGSGGGDGGGGGRQPLKERPAAGMKVAAPQGNLLGFGPDSPEPVRNQPPKSKTGVAAAVAVPNAKGKEKSLDTDEDLMEFLLNDANFN